MIISKIEYNAKLVGVIALAIGLLPGSSFANEAQYAALKDTVSKYEFIDGQTVSVRVSGEVDRRYGMGLLIVKTIEVKVGRKTVDPAGLDKLVAGAPGLKLETMQFSREVISDGEHPSYDYRYTLQFDYFADAFGSIRTASWEHRKRMEVDFNSHGVILSHRIMDPKNDAEESTVSKGRVRSALVK